MALPASNCRLVEVEGRQFYLRDDRKTVLIVTDWIDWLLRRPSGDATMLGIVEGVGLTLVQGSVVFLFVHSGPEITFACWAPRRSGP
jgi:hypothetical protein